MIYKAIIDLVLNDGYSAKIRIPKLHKIENSSGATPSKDLPIASICMLPGILPAYKKGDIVFVSFENDAVEYPIILGLLYCEQNISLSNIKALSISVDSSANLPVSTTIDNILQSKVLGTGDISVILSDNTKYEYTNVTSLNMIVANGKSMGIIVFSTLIKPTLINVTGYISSIGDDIHNANAGEVWEFNVIDGKMIWYNWGILS